MSDACGGRRRRDRRGFALVAALWLLVALSALGLELALHSRSARLATANTLDQSRGRAAALAGLEHACAHLERLLLPASAAADRQLDPWRDVVGRARSLRDTVVLDDVRYLISIRDVGGLLDINRAGEAELRRFFDALRVDAGLADRLAQAILDWRDADDLHRGRGAERADYLAGGAAALPRNAPFQSLDELRHVRGMTREIFERARPFLTMSGGGQVNLNVAERPVLLALPGFGEEAVAVILRTRRGGRRIGSIDELVAQLSSGARERLVAEYATLATKTTFVTRELEVESEGWSDGALVHVRARALMVRGGSHAFVIWRRVE